jgi:MGT family glycosyltransferase
MLPTPPPAGAPAPLSPPLVYVTLGTAFANVDIFRAALDGLADEPVEVVVTVGADQDPVALAPTPTNARVERFIPQSELLPRCSAVVHHGGSGTVFGSLAHGLPQVVVPQGADNFINASLITRAGAGLTLGPDEVTPESIRHAVRSVLANPSYATAARRLAAETTALPSPADVAQTLQRRFGGKPKG